MTVHVFFYLKDYIVIYSLFISLAIFSTKIFIYVKEKYWVITSFPSLLIVKKKKKNCSSGGKHFEKKLITVK